MKFVIRDDDLNFFSKSEDIERWYADIFAQHIPVGFSTIPFVKPESDVYTAGAAFEEKEYPISGNAELVAYVRSNPLIEILQHGTTHETVGGVFEYANPNIPRDEAARGREELEKTFGTTVNIFVPPHDWIGRSGVFAIEAAHLDIIRGRGAGLRNVVFRSQYLFIFFRMLAYKLFHSFKTKIPAYPFVLDFGKHKEVCSYRLEDTDVFEGLEYAQRKNGIFIVVTHLHFYTDEKKKRLRELIAKGREVGAEFVRPGSLFAPFTR